VALVGRRSPVLEFIGSFGAQGCWESDAHYYRFLDTPEVRQMASAEFTKYFNGHLLAAWAFGTSLIGRRDKAILRVEDYKGLKMRTSGTAQATMYKALGAIPIGLSSKEIYTALQRGTIQGATSGVSRWRRSKLYEVAPYLTVDPTIPYFSMWLVINQHTWDKLSKADQKLLSQTAKIYESWTRTYAAREREEDFAFLKKKATAFVTLPKAEKNKLITTVKPIMKQFAQKQLKEQFTPLWTLMEKAR
jgi:TRAP-type C4-dicarboxylate transport system substrate-binding protein